MTRRHLLRWLTLLSMTALGVPTTARRALAAAAGACAPTPRQTTGPFYPVRGIAGAPTDLTRTRPGGPRARGEVLYLSGRVTGPACRPVAGAEVEIWQADVDGRYNHPLEAPSRGPLDPNFGYWGEAITDAEGRYAFTTIIPAPYDGRTAHVHFRVVAPGRPPLVTQMYFAGHPGNDRDGILNALSPAERARVVVAVDAADDREPGAKRAAFEIALG